MAHLFRMGNNVIAYQKNGTKYGMTCAWAQMIDYDHITMLLGSQSVTGNNLEVGDVVGVSALATGQKNISLQIGSNHSDQLDKFEDVAISFEKSAILVQNAKVKMVCEVEKIMHLVDPNDNFVILKVLSQKVDKNKEFLSLEEVLPE